MSAADKFAWRTVAQISQHVTRTKNSRCARLCRNNERFGGRITRRVILLAKAHDNAKDNPTKLVEQLEAPGPSRIEELTQPVIPLAEAHDSAKDNPTEPVQQLEAPGPSRTEGDNGANNSVLLKDVEEGNRDENMKNDDDQHRRERVGKGSSKSGEPKNGEKTRKKNKKVKKSRTTKHHLVRCVTVT